MENMKRFLSVKYMLILTIPIFIEIILQMVVGYCDQFMMKSYPSSVNAITNSLTIINMIINCFFVFSSASIILITQYKGANDLKREKEIYSVSFYANLGISLFISLFLLIFAKPLLTLIKVPNDAFNDALLYTLIVGGTIGFQIMSLTISAFLKSNSLMKESMIINIIINFINIIGNIVLINLFKKYDMAVVGVALSSAISRIIGLILMLIVYFIKIKIPLSVITFKEKFRFVFSKILKVGGPSGGESLSYNSSQIIIQIVINRICIYNNNIQIGNVKTYASMFAMITYMFTSAFSQAMQVIIGQLIGAGYKKETHKKVWQTIIISSIVSVSIAVLFYIFSDNCFKIFNINDPYLLKIGKNVMLAEIFLELGRAFNIIFVRALQTAGDVYFPTILAIIFCWLIAVGGSFVLGDHKFLGLGLAGVWIAMAIDECLRAIIFIFRFQSGKWKKYSFVE